MPEEPESYDYPGLSVGVHRDADRVQYITVSGSLSWDSIPDLWDDLDRICPLSGVAGTVVDAAGISYCDAAGMALFLNLQKKCRSNNVPFSIKNLSEEFERLWQQFDLDVVTQPRQAVPRYTVLTETGRGVRALTTDIYKMICFLGELCTALVRAVLYPHRTRWRTVLLMTERAGANAFPMVALISFIAGLVVAFRAGHSLRLYGAEATLGNFLGIALFTELGPLLTAVILASRSGSAFAAELGTMRLTQETDALITIGIDPVRFLVVPRVMAAMLAMPLLTAFFDLFGLAGGSVVAAVMGQPAPLFLRRILEAVTLHDIIGSVIKAVLLGFIAGGVGCMRGLQTHPSARDVGQAATRAVVTGIVLISLADAVFAVVYYRVGI